MVASLTEISREEETTFAKFKENVSDLKQHDTTLLRFLRARNCDLVKAEEMIRNAEKWREEVDLKNYKGWVFPSYFKKEMAYEYYGEDFEGSPCLYMHIGKWNGKSLVEKGQSENLLKWTWKLIESGVETIPQHGSAGFLIVDMEGLTYSQATHVPSLKLFYTGCQKMEQCYPEILKRVFIINTPWMFTMAWSLIKGVIEKKTHEKIRIFGTNKEEWMGALMELCSLDNIIPEFRPYAKKVKGGVNKAMLYRPALPVRRPSVSKLGVSLNRRESLTKLPLTSSAQRRGSVVKIGTPSTIRRGSVSKTDAPPARTRRDSLSKANLPPPTNRRDSISKIGVPPPITRRDSLAKIGIPPPPARTRRDSLSKMSIPPPVTRRESISKISVPPPSHATSRYNCKGKQKNR